MPAVWMATTPQAPPKLVRSQLAFLRFAAGMRALLALLGSVVLFTSGASHAVPLAAIVLPYLLFAAALLALTLGGWTGAGSRLWLWIDAGVLSWACHLVAADAPWLGVATVLPVVAMALQAGSLHALVLAVASASALLFAGGWHWSPGNLPHSLPLLVLALGPGAAFLAQPSRELRQRLQVLETFNESSDPRQGLLHHVDVLLGLLTTRFRLDSAVISLQGPEPRIFERSADGVTRRLQEPVAELWRERRRKLPDDIGCVWTVDSRHVAGVRLEPFTGARVDVDEVASAALRDIGRETLALPLMSYGKPLGHLCLMRAEPPFTVSDLQWLDGLMREALPLLERSDLLEQLQRESAAREREHIGRDLHDSAVQPYLGLKYGLEALSRQAGPDNPVAPAIRQLVKLTTEELQTLRDVVSGLRSGQDSMQSTSFMAALHRQAQRFEALYGLKVNIFSPDALQLRGSAAKAVLHMVNEGLTNVRRHTSATAVTVLLDVQQDEVVMCLRNDLGPAAAVKPTPTEAFVPRSLNERATEFGGGVRVSREPDCTEVIITLPMLGALG